MAITMRRRCTGCRARRFAFRWSACRPPRARRSRHDEPAGYNLYEIEGAWGAWRCTAISRGWRDGGFGEVNRQALFA